MLEVKDLSEEIIWGQIKNTNRSFAVGYIGSLLDFGLIKYELFYIFIKKLNKGARRSGEMKVPVIKITSLIVSEAWMLEIREKIKSAHFRLTSCGVVGLSDSSDARIKQTAQELESVLKEIDNIELKKVNA